MPLPEGNPHRTNNYVVEDDDDDYDIEGVHDDEADEAYYDEKEQELAQLHIQNMMQQVVKLTE